ncbi:hypothetical protein [Pseudorhodobacter sp.]|uniref:hypothetical protein n=1 Tax=Pseudorhodobacter sp. TaxID=1934400 RepID=UPI002AFDE4E7|nr:hypothetical protein [Pseudorhodobacter sp.]
MQIEAVITRPKARAADLRSAEGAALTQQNELRLAELVYGRDSVQVADLQADAARAVRAEMVAQLDIAESQKDALMAAWDATAQSEAATHAWAGAMASVAAEIGGILSALSQIGGGMISNAAKAVEIAALKSGKSVGDARLAATRSQIDAEYKARDMGAQSWFDKSVNWADREVKLRGLTLDEELGVERAATAKREAERDRAGKGRTSGAGRKSGTSELEKQQKALDDLIASQERELELLRESDPIRKELLRHREALAGATDAERAKVEELISTRMRETEQMESLQWVSKQAGNALIDALMGGADAGEQLIKTLQRAILEAALLGEGPLSGLLGGGGLFGGGGKGFLGSIAGLFGGAGGAPATASFTGIYATGGMVHGPGSGTSDDITAKLSNGEYVVNARSTARYRHLLEAMNSGSPIPGYAAGGAVGGSRASLHAPAAMSAPPLSFVINDYSGQKVEATQGSDGRGQPQVTMTIGQQAAAAVSQRGNAWR